MTALAPVPRGQVATVMRIQRTRRINELGARRPTRLVPGSVLPRVRSERLIERLEGFLDHLDERAEVLLIEDGRQVPYSMPSDRFKALGIREGDRFWVEVIEVDGAVTGRVVRAEPEPSLPAPERYLTPDELSARADPWD